MKKIAGILGLLMIVLAAEVIILIILKPYDIRANSGSIEIIRVDEKPEHEKILLDVPVVLQMPELPRGCEVTSLAMMLNNAGVKVDKLQLAEKIKKVPFKQDQLYGNPDKGFVGSMFNMSEPGLGVYHKPVAELAGQFLPHKIVDLTGEEFYWVIKYLDRGRPVWVINNTNFDRLANENWEFWNTSSGTIRVTYKEHSVLITGYDPQNIYFNDPLTGEKNRKVPRESFIEGWKQMGKQAITYTK